MKDFFVGKTFNEELEFWEYLHSIKNNRFEYADGYYWAHAHGLHQNFKVYAVDYFTNYDILKQATYKTIFSETRFVLGLRDNYLFRIFFESHTVSGLLEKKSTDWQLTSFSDLFEDDSYLPQKITQKEMQNSCAELVKLLIIQGKKVD